MSQHYSNTDDPRYDFSICSACGKEWQNIDFGCALHYFTCTKVETAERIPSRKFEEK
jgi:hypothetical protein